ncbi:AAA family ATPase [Desulfosediminicola ganghwensis]|uniref:AAA family ATPase n=1 Tax=Desulfosediminicola ganghwensis TaxID=2569540 RepID=UPI0010AC8B69|nr:DUF3696 domain-containing protein [Desulfosediminicola ganghwensis]
MITRINLRNFKAFERSSLRLKPITILLGPNNSGKSSVLASLRMLSQTLESYDTNVPLLLNGNMGDFGTYKDVVFNNNTRRHFEITLSLKSSGGRAATGVRRFARKGDRIRVNLKYKYRSSIREVILKEIKFFRNGIEIFHSHYSDDSEKHIIQKIKKTEIPINIRSFLSNNLRLFHFLPRALFVPTPTEDDNSLRASIIRDTRSTLRNLPYYLDEVNHILTGMEYIGAMRVPPSRSYMFSGERNRRVGSNGENAPNILMMDALRKGSKSRDIKNQVVEWLNRAGIASDIKIVNISDRYYELHIQNPVTREYQNFSDVGYGNSQIIPILVAGFNLDPNSVLMVEEPEIHLHPKAQAELGNFFLSLYSQNIQSIIETHSEHLIVRIQQHIAEGLISPEDIAIHYVYPKNNAKFIKTIPIDENGIFTEEWPEGFFPIRLEEAKKLAKIRHFRQTTN